VWLDCSAGAFRDFNAAAHLRKYSPDTKVVMIVRDPWQVNQIQYIYLILILNYIYCSLYFIRQLVLAWHNRQETVVSSSKQQFAKHHLSSKKYNTHLKKGSVKPPCDMLQPVQTIRTRKSCCIGWLHFRSLTNFWWLTNIISRLLTQWSILWPIYHPSNHPLPSTVLFDFNVLAWLT
jgi:hypothetical protein